MSWLNLNDSLNTLKGQITNFANTVLVDEDEVKGGSSNSNVEIEKLQEICKKQQDEINYLQRLNAELGQGNNTSPISKNDGLKSNETWSWEVPDLSDTCRKETEEIVADLKKTVSELEKEKQELKSDLVLLDSEHQLHNEKLVAMKNNLQKEYNELKHNYNKLQKENELLVENEKRFEAELKDVKIKYQAALENRLTTAETHVDSNETCVKCESFLQENQRYLSATEKLTNEIKVLTNNNNTLQKALDHYKTAKDDEVAIMEEKLQLYVSENKILTSELQKATQSISVFEKKSEVDAENCKRLAGILEGYEHQVSSLKKDLMAKELEYNENINKMKAEIGGLQEQLQCAVVKRKRTHTKYVNILTENMKRYIECDKSSENIENLENEVSPAVLEFSHQVESIVNILLDLKSKCENLEKELYNVTQEKTNMLAEKNHEIEKLIQNSEILSQEVITKTQAVKDYENECNELIKNNDILINELKIFKNSSGLQTISESNEDNILLLESQLENANKKIEELENMVTQKGKNPEDNEEEYFPKTFDRDLLEELEQLRKENALFKQEIEKHQHVQTVLNDEKDKLILTLEKLKIDLENAEYQCAESNINMEVLKEELENQKKNSEELQEQILSLRKLIIELERSNEDVRSNLNLAKERLLVEEDVRRQCEGQVRNFTEKLQNAKMTETSLKLQYDTISRELIGANESKCSMESNLKECVSNLNQYREELQILKESNERLSNIIEELESQLENEKKNVADLNMNIKQLKEEDHKELTAKHGQLENINLDECQGEYDVTNETNLNYDTVIEEKVHLEKEIEKLNVLANEHLNCHENIIELEKKIKELEAVKNELTNVIITKHQESVTYHNEIQRLTHALRSKIEENSNLEARLQAINMEITDRTEIIKKNEKIDKLNDENDFLKQKCEILAKNLLDEQNRCQKILTEKSGFSEKEQLLSKKLQRLQAHLIEVEEHYTHELLLAEERNSKLQSKVSEIEEREKNSSTMYTSVSIRANQQVETLQHQLQLVTNQRDELRKKISDAEDHANKQEAALTNLQFVLEQFQKDKEKDVLKETERIRRQINIEKKIQEDLRNEIGGLQLQIEESKHGLSAASRLSDQLEHSRQQVTTLKAEVLHLKEKLQRNEEDLQNLSSQSDGKVDKSLIKNLIIGFVSTYGNINKDQTQILKIIATVLDFNQQDHDKVNLNKTQQGWLSSVLNPQTSQSLSQESLSQAFVKFLENESKPRLVPSLLNNNSERTTSRKNSATARQSPSILTEIVLPTFADFAQNRNSSSILKDVLKDNN